MNRLSITQVCQLLTFALGLNLFFSSCHGDFKNKWVFVDKIKDSEFEKRQMAKFPVRKGMREIKFTETAPQFIPDDNEKKMGFVLFKRSIMEAVLPGSIPLPEERLTALSAFAAKGEFEPLCFSVYPLKNLNNFKVRMSSLKCGDVEIPEKNIRTALLTYWNVRYPTYNSRETYSVMPELLENVTVDDVSQKQSQRYWITIQVPKNAKPGVYTGHVYVAHDGFEKAVSIPVKFRVLPFKLLKDPDKHYSAYNYDIHREADKRRRLSERAKAKGNEWIFKAARNEYKAMFDYGFDRAPTLYLDYDLRKKEFYFSHGKRSIDEILKTGMKGPVPVPVSGMGRFYYSVTGGKQMGGHCATAEAQPCPDFYKILKKKLMTFEKTRRENNWPEFIYCPLDEVAPASQKFGVKVYKVFKEIGMKTYATKNPSSADAANYAPFVDVWCAGKFEIPFKKAAFDKKRECWCYPNGVVDGNRKYRIRARGGRMTYGFGFWKSGYSMLIPWIWRTTNPDYLSKYSSCGNQFDEDGNFIPAYYWECYREGVDDLKYIYTLKTAIARRKNCKSEECQKAIEEGKNLLQNIWDMIPVKKLYLEEGLWNPQDFNCVRWMIAKTLMKLIKFPETNKDLPEFPMIKWDKTASTEERSFEKLLNDQIKKGNASVLKLGDEDFSAWRKTNAEGSIKVVNDVKCSGENSLRFDVLVDHEIDGGGEKGTYKVGWPRFQRYFPKCLNMAQYDYLSLKVMANSPTYSDDYLSFYLAFHSKLAKGTMHFIPFEISQNSWQKIVLPVKDLIDAREGRKAWEFVTSITFGVCESNYLDKTQLRFYIDQMELVKFKQPTIGEVEFPRFFLCPQKYLTFNYSLPGSENLEPGMYFVCAEILNGKSIISKVSQDAFSKKIIFMSVQNIKPGKYQLKLFVKDNKGNVCSEKTERIEAVKGPFWK